MQLERYFNLTIASRSFPFVSKVLHINFIDVATRALVKDPSLASIVPKEDLMTLYRPYKCVKNPIFSWTRLAGADPLLGVEMASTGEVACFGRDLNEAFFTSLFSNHNNYKNLPMTGIT
jgi:carbamoyl-phosphate synthase large subunit